MFASNKRRIAALTAATVVALGLYGCGGGGGDRVIIDPEPTPTAVSLAAVTAGFMAGAGTVTITAGQSVDHDDIAFSCAAGGADCEVEVMVDANGAITATSTGGMVTAMNSAAYTARITPMAVDLAPVTAGFMAGAGTVTITAGQTADHGDIAFSCAAGGADCTVTVEVDTNGAITATSTGGMVTAMNSDAYNVRLTPVAVDLASVTAGFMAGAGTVTIMAGQTADHGDIAFSCAAGGADCQVMVMVDANGDITATSTGGMVTAINSTAYDDRIATMHPIVGKWAGDWPGGARTVLIITSVSSDGQVTGTYRHQERGGQPFVLEISPDGPVTASLQSGVLSFSYGQSTFEFTQTAQDTFGFTFQFDPSAQMVSIDVGRQDADGMMPTDVPSVEALANVIDLVANDSRQDLFGNYVSGWWWRSHGIGAQQAAVTGTYRGGQWANAIVSHDDNGKLQHNVAVLQINPLQQADPLVEIGRYINTYNAPEELEGVTNSVGTISDHGLGPEWQVTELTADYVNAGTLDIYVASDVQPSDGSQDPFELATQIDYNIKLPGAPALPADQDFLSLRIDDGDSIEGSLDGVSGSFSCANVGGCSFATDHRPGDYYASSPGVTFTPDGGTPQGVTPSWSGTVPNADYLAIGHWLYVPEDVTDSVNYEFGVFASGGDPFEVTYLAPLAGTATYLGDALGMYYVGGLSDDPIVGSFTADVTLEADFGDVSETGFISGEVNRFEFEHDVASSLPSTVNLTSDPYSYLSTNFGVVEDLTNIFDTTWSGDAAPNPGGHIAAEATASADGQAWYGEWHAVFYGNGLATTDIPPSYVEHPTSVAGTFNVSTYDHNKRVDRGLTGSFGAHRYDDSLTTPPLFVPGTFQTSHELQVSAIQMDWRAFHNDPGSAIAYGDFDNDGDEDFFIVPGNNADSSVCAPGDSYCANPTYPQIWENVGQNQFKLNTQKFFSGPLPQLVNVRKTITGDFNGDGKLDLFLATHGPAAPPLPREEPPALFLSTDTGFVQSQALDHLIGYNHGAASADIDQDGDLDIFVTDGSHYFLINDGNGRFLRNTRAVPAAINDQGVFTAELVDVDSDGYPDLLVGGHEFSYAPTAIYWGDNSAQYSESRMTVLPRVEGQGVVVDIDVGDLDGDGNKDIVVNRTASEPFYAGLYIQVISGLGSRQFSDSTSQQMDFGEKDVDKWVLWLRLVDINDDGSLDIVVDGNFAQPGTTWLNDGSGNLALVRERPRPYLLDWMKITNGLGDAQIRQSMNSVISASDSLVHVSASASGDARTFDAANPVAGSVGNVDLGDVTYQEIAGFHSPRIPLALGYRERGGDSFLGFGAWLDHSMFGVTGSLDADSAIEASTYSLGTASGSNPVSGTATWSGAVVGIDGHALGRGQVVRGKSEVTVDFADASVDVELSGMTFLARGHSWIHDMTWNNIPLSSDGFATGADDDFIEGRFYGSGHEEVGGVFMRNYIIGAFGGRRVE